MTPDPTVVLSDLLVAAHDNAGLFLERRDAVVIAHNLTELLELAGFAITNTEDR
jgi:hypothetical protein